MKHLTLFILLSPILAFSQIKWKKEIAPICLTFVAGMADGLNQTISYNWTSFKAKTGANTHFWWPSTSYQNKYKNGRKENGEAFWGSTTIFVAFTDGYHLTRFINHLTTAGAISIKIALFQKQKWWVYICQGMGYWAVNRLGFNTIYQYFK